MKDDLSQLSRILKNGITQETLDCAKRAADSIRLHCQAAGTDLPRLANKWIAISLSDGRGADTLYDSREDAMRFQLHEQQCAYMSLKEISIRGYGPKLEHDLAIFIQFTKDAYRNGFRLPDPDAAKAERGRQLLMTSRQYDFYEGRQRNVR